MTETALPRLIDMHSHWGTEHAYPLRTEEELQQQVRVWGSRPRYATEEEMVQEFRRNNAQVILDFGFTKYLPLEEARSYHDYALRMQAAHSDAILGQWLQIDPRTGERGVAEVERCAHAGTGFIGLAVSGSASGFAASDPVYRPFYEYCEKARIPVLIMVGYTGLGAGVRGGRGVRLELCHPRYVDDVAIDYPDLPIVAARSAWPWQDEMIAVMLHKPNVWCELHGWAPKHLTPALKRDISRRLKDRIMFGADYPLFTYSRLVADWRAEGYDAETLERVFSGNAEAFLKSLKA